MSNQFFYEGMSSFEDRKRLMTHEIWHPVVAAINASKGKLRVGTFDPTYSATVDLVNEMGFIAASVSLSGKKYSFQIHTNPISLRSGYEICKSTRAKYISTKIRAPKNPNDDKSDGYIRLEDAVNRSCNAVNSFAAQALEIVRRHINPHTTIPVINLSSECTTLLTRIFMKELHPAEVDQAQLAYIEQQYKSYLDKCKKLSDMFSGAKDFFSCDKWVVVNNYRKVNEQDTVIVGAISRHPILAALEKSLKDDSLPPTYQFTYADITVPFKWYTSFDAVPDEIRKEIEVQLVMNKLQAGRETLLPSENTHRDTVWLEGGALMIGDYSAGTVMFLDKQS